MKKTILAIVIAGSVLLQSCGSNESTKNETSTDTTKVDSVLVDTVVTHTVDTVKTK